MSTKEITDGDSLIVFASVSNTGSIDGSKNIDLFISDEYASISPANKKLKSFTKVNLESGNLLKYLFYSLLKISPILMILVKEF